MCLSVALVTTSFLLLLVRHLFLVATFRALLFFGPFELTFSLRFSEQAGLSPNMITIAECHGTGEVATMDEKTRRQRERDRRSNKKLLETSASLLVSSALLVVTRTLVVTRSYSKRAMKRGRDETGRESEKARDVTEKTGSERRSETKKEQVKGRHETNRFLKILKGLCAYIFLIVETEVLRLMFVDECLCINLTMTEKHETSSKG